MQKYLEYFDENNEKNIKERDKEDDFNELNYNKKDINNDNNDNQLDLNNYQNLNFNFKQKNFINFLDEKYEIGICVHAVDYLFSEIDRISNKKFKVKISYLEIYNEQVRDLLVDSNQGLMIVEDAQKGVIVPDLIEIIVNDSSELIKLIIMGNSRRTMAPTGQNLFSSRSHAILQIQVEQHSKIRDVKEEHFCSKFLLVDLAGSERGGLEKGIRTHEGKNINKSLLSLGNCINLLSDNTKKGSFVPYRDSKLTRLLKDSLGGNIKTAMIACISPSPTLYDETVNTLKYAMRARKIEKCVTKNVKEVEVHISQYRDIIDSLKNEIEQLKQVIKNQENIIQVATPLIPGDYSENKAFSNLYNNNNKNLNFKSEFEVDDENLNIDINNINVNINSLRNNQKEKQGNSYTNKKPKSSLSVRAFSNINDINIISNNNNNKNEHIGTSAGKTKSINSLNEIKQLNLASGVRKNTYSSMNMNINTNIKSIQKNLNESNSKQISKKTFDSINIYLNTNENPIKDKENNDHLRKLSASPCSSTFKDFDISGYRSFLFNNSVEDDCNMDELEKNIDK